MPLETYTVFFHLNNVLGVPAVLALVWYWVGIIEKTRRISKTELYWCRVALAATFL